MDIQKFIRLREYLYHLTDEENLDSIFSDNKLKSTTILTQLARLPNRDMFIRTRRVGHFTISRGSFSAKLRDQDPLFEKIVIKNLDPGMTFGDFVLMLNSRVFFWATEKDLISHYERYARQNEYPKIIKVRTSDLILSNQHQPQFCRLNSGGPRCSAYYPEGAPRRGTDTFQYANDYSRTPSSIREVTYEEFCYLPDSIWIANRPAGRYSLKK